ncbi:hypothetical protein, partial [Pararhizobium sp. BT-229]|uniref:hypothetical protein n=1 Tax=Pararhizobium sp. BT-229 TaxID=2986923 RepID=UPI0021F70A94
MFLGVVQNNIAITGTCKKLHFFENSLLTSFGASDYKPLTNEGGGAAGDRRTRSEVSYESLVRIVG